MHKTFAFALAAITLAGASALPAQAATRMADLQPHVFANRCADNGGSVSQAAATLTCVTPQVAVACEFKSLHRASCAWDGAETRPVTRLIGTLTTLPSSSSFGLFLGGNGGGGGIQVPDLPFDNGGGGGGIDVPDLPINNK
ncbi:hypothetical protein ACFSX5_08125 [Devosia albogilva]|uniref:Uncharacterized protein n=1 Tax=Devosia albogilva TaxID=429726 RepID=A0ABW5QJ93_9HYPH